MEYCGIDIHVSYSQICILDEEGEVMETSRVRTSRPALTKFFARRDRMKIVLEAGEHDRHTVEPHGGGFRAVADAVRMSRWGMGRG